MNTLGSPKPSILARMSSLLSQYESAALCEHDANEEKNRIWREIHALLKEAEENGQKAT